MPRLKKKNKTLLVLLIIPVLILLIALVGISLLSPTSVEELEKTGVIKSTNQVLFIPGSVDGALGDIHTIDIALNPSSVDQEDLKYVSLKIAYDPQNLRMRDISKGTASGIYQASVLLDENQEPVGLASLVWMPNEYGYGESSDETIGRLSVELLSSARQSIGVTPLGTEGNLVNSSIESISGKELELESDDLSINGGVYIHDEWLNSEQNACEGACSSDEVCLGGRCEKLAAASLGPASNVLGASTDGMVACESDAECIKVSSSCCDCDQGGREIAINQDYESEFRTSLECSGGDYVCLDYNMCENSIARCISNVCQLGETGVLGATWEKVQGDFNGDTYVDLKDYSIMLSEMLLCRNDVVCNNTTDLDQDGEVKLSDFILFFELHEAE